jgi:chromosome partitioning protein
VKTIAVLNQKGGCGKTTTAINVAAVLAARHHRVLLVDLDPQSHCAAGLGVPESGVEYSTIDLLRHPPIGTLDVDEFSGLTWEVTHGLHLLASTVRLAAAEAPGGGIMELPDRDRRLERALAAFSDQVDLCIVDCPPTIGLLTFNAIRAADEILVPVETGFFSTRGAARQWATLQSMATRLSRPICARVVPNMVRENDSLDHDLLRTIRKQFTSAVSPIAIRHHTEIREASGLGRAVIDHAPESDAAKDYEALVDWLLESPPVTIVPKPIEEDASDGAACEPVIATRSVRSAELASRLRREASETEGAATTPPPVVGPTTTPGSFVLVQPARLGEKIGITGDFNHWHCAGLELHTMDTVTGGALVGIELSVPPGLVRYRLVVDGREALDPANSRTGEGPDGRPCSVVEVPATDNETNANLNSKAPDAPWTQTQTPLTN